MTLNKDDFDAAFQYKDRFLSSTEFQWQSQNATGQGTPRGQLYMHHKQHAVQVHLFVRPTAKEAGKAARFFYCGDVEFIRWEGEKPITIWWRLNDTLPTHLHERMGVNSPDTPA